MTTQERDGGWVELLREGESEPIGRGRIVFTELPSDFALGMERTVKDKRMGDWRARLDPLTFNEGTAPASPGRYVVRFEQNGEELAIYLEEPQQQGDEAYAEVGSADGQLPTVLLELGGE
jgi:hypothetical protein